MAVSNLLIYEFWFTTNYFSNVVIIFSDLQNIGIDTSFDIFACLITELLQKMVQNRSKVGNLAAILFMQIRCSKTKNFAWEPGLSDSAYLNYVKKYGSQLLPQNAPNIQIFQKSH